MRISNILPAIVGRVRYLLTRRCYGSLGRGVVLKRLLRIDGTANIHIADRVVVQKGTWLAAMPLTNNPHPRLEIGGGTVIGHYNHIYATPAIMIEENVLTADRVYISDNLHSYEEVGTPILRQPIKQLRPVTIGAGAWLGEGVCVIGASVGRGSVVGANSVVTKDIPDYCVAVGAPARVIKRYNPDTRQWEKVS